MSLESEMTVVRIAVHQAGQAILQGFCYVSVGQVYTKRLRR